MSTKAIQTHKQDARRRVWTPMQVLLVFIISLFVLSCVLPFLNVIALSLSSKSAILRQEVSFWPVEFNLKAYELIFKDKTMIRSLFFTVEVTVIHTAIAMVMTVLIAYPLSKERLRGRKFINLFALFTMYFSGGIIPVYLNIKDLNLINTPWSLILPTIISTYYMIIMKSFFAALPGELEEAAIIDGANDFQVLTRVYLPLSLASMATITLFYAVAKWNSFQDAKFYITSRDLQPLQLKLYNIIEGSQAVEVATMEGSGAATQSSSVSESIEAATIIYATLPILVVYPFVQRYFVAGVTIGAVKG